MCHGWGSSVCDFKQTPDVEGEQSEVQEAWQQARTQARDAAPPQDPTGNTTNQWVTFVSVFQHDAVILPLQHHNTSKQHSTINSIQPPPSIPYHLNVLFPLGLSRVFKCSDTRDLLSKIQVQIFGTSKIADSQSLINIVECGKILFGDDVFIALKYTTMLDFKLMKGHQYCHRK